MVLMSRKSAILLGCAAFIAISNPVFPQSSAQTLPEMSAIVEAYNSGDFVTARNGLAQLAETGNPFAQYRYGRILAEGRGGPQDIPNAIQWLDKAVHQNQTEAATLLARILLGSPGITPDPERAVTLLQRSAARGDTEAQFLLARILEQGEIVDQDFESAHNWYLAAAENQHVEAQFRLSNAIAAGRGTTADITSAIVWLERAARNGFVPAQLAFATRLETGNGVEKRPSEAIDWLRRAAEAGSPLGQRILGSKYLFGDGVEENIAEALKWLHAAAEQDEPGALSNLGFVYSNGKGVEKDEVRGFDYYQRAADRGLIRAMLVVGLMHENGTGTPKDPFAAAKSYRNALASGEEAGGARLGALIATGALEDQIDPIEAAPWVAAAAGQGDPASLNWLKTQSEQNNHRASGRLANLLFASEDDRDHALSLFDRAANNGDVFAQFRLGELYATGDGVPQDYIRAHKWMNIAATLGNESAVEKRAVISQLMTPTMLAEAQAATRAYFAAEANRVPKTEQSVTVTE